MNSKAHFFCYESLWIDGVRFLDAFLAMSIFCGLIYFHMENLEAFQIWKTGGIIFMFTLIFFHLHKIYRSFRFSSLRYEIHEVFSACFSLFFVLFITGYTVGILHHLPRGVILAWMILWPLSLALMRILIRKLVRSFRIKGLNVKKAVIAGRNRSGMNLARHIQDNPWTGTRIMGFFYDEEDLEDVKENKFSRFFPYLGNIDALIESAEKGEIDIIYLALNTYDEKATRKLIKAVDRLPTILHYVPEILFLDLVIGGEIIFFDQRPIIVLRNTAIGGVGGAAKRLMDLLLSFPALVILFPLFMVIAAAIKLDSKGPVFYNQTRYGINGEKIHIYKFRSMYEGCDKPGAAYAQARKNDARITKAGAFLRKTSLDELPQLINVLQGRMSLVGPRPHPVAMNEYYQKIIAGYTIRHKVKPGITGLAQVNGYRGETDSLEKMEKRITHDLRYIREWSLLFDLEILIRTLFVFLFQKNAY